MHINQELNALRSPVLPHLQMVSLGVGMRPSGGSISNSIGASPIIIPPIIPKNGPQINPILSPLTIPPTRLAISPGGFSFQDQKHACMILDGLCPAIVCSGIISASSSELITIMIVSSLFSSPPISPQIGPRIAPRTGSMLSQSIGLVGGPIITWMIGLLPVNLARSRSLPRPSTRPKNSPPTSPTSPNASTAHDR